jgi:hypothetical protein
MLIPPSGVRWRISAFASFGLLSEFGKTLGEALLVSVGEVSAGSGDGLCLG